MQISLYVHIPFCRRRCSYCDFHTWSGLDSLMPEYVDAVTAELRWLQDWSDWRASTLYLGGGTPSLLPVEGIVRVVEAVPSTPDVEVTLEVNPATLDPGSLVTLRAAGVNRLSIGMQSASRRELALLGRLHDYPAVREAVRGARAAGFNNLNLDLIYGLPGQGSRGWLRSLRSAISLQPDHLSLYALSVEPGTPLAKEIAEGRLSLPDPDRAADMYELACQYLEAEGMVHYEISNWSLPGRECRHNLAYWRNEAYLGVGAAAWGHWQAGDTSWRLRNVLHPRAYLDRLAGPADAPAEDLPLSPANDHCERVPPAMAMAETMFMGLRLLVEGVSGEAFRSRFGLDPLQVYPRQLDELQRSGRIRCERGRVLLQPSAVLTANQVFSAFLPEPASEGD